MKGEPPPGLVIRHAQQRDQRVILMENAAFLMGQGFSAVAAARKLGISVRTIERYKARWRQAEDVADRIMARLREEGLWQ